MHRAASPVVAVPLLVGISLVLVAVLGTTVIGMANPPEPVDPVVVDATATANGRIVLVHEAGPTINMTGIDVRIAVNGEALEKQPVIPSTGSPGFLGTPTGPFNSASHHEWEVGESASLKVAGSNDPDLTVGATVTVRLVRDGIPVAYSETLVEDP